MASAPLALLLDDGDLGGVRRALERLGVEILQASGSPTVEMLHEPYALLVTSLRQALSLPPHRVPTTRRVWMCVHDVDPLHVREKLRRLGVDFLVRADTEADALRLMLARILRPGGEPSGSAADEVEEGKARSPSPERRRHRRGFYRQRITALGLIRDAASNVVLGRDLSVSGMRIEAHPNLLIGCQTTLAIHTGGREEPIVVQGAVVHDGDGLGIEFRSVTEDQRGRLERLVSRLPPAEALSASGGSPGELVISRVVGAR
jgi:hypothetical protein